MNRHSHMSVALIVLGTALSEASQGQQASQDGSTAPRAVDTKALSESARREARMAMAGGATFPRLAAISYAGKYDATAQDLLSKYGLVIIGIPRAEPPLVDGIKSRNPKTLVGFYTVLNEASRTSAAPLAKERAAKLDKEGWWLRDSTGRDLQWTKEFTSFDINVTEWVKPDADGYQYPEWAARLWHRWVFAPVPAVDIWFFDNVFVKQRLKKADWKQIGEDQSGDDPTVQSAFRRAQAKEVAIARKLAPDKLMVGNSDNDLSSPEYAGMLDGAQMECMVGNSWSIDTWGGWEKMMERYRKVAANLAEPKIMVFGLCMKDFSNFRQLRYALTSSLMGDAYFQVSDTSARYSVWPWFDEFEADLGVPEEAAFPSRQNGGYYQRRFSKGIAIVNPTNEKITVPIDPGFRSLRIQQDPLTNSGGASSSVQLAPKDGVILVRHRE